MTDKFNIAEFVPQAQQQTQQQQTQQQSQQPINEQKLLSELGFNVKSKDELIPKTSLDQELLSYLEYKKETGRDLKDFVQYVEKLKTIDTLEDSDDVIMEYIRKTNPVAEDEEVLKSIFEKKYAYKKKEEEEDDIDDIFEDDEQTSKKKKASKEKSEIPKEILENRKRAIEEYKKLLREEAERYKIPSEEKSYEKLREELKEEFKNFVQKNKSINFAVSKDKQLPFVLDEATTSNVVIHPEEMIKMFVGEDGQFDMNKYFQKMVLFSNMEKIIPIVWEQAYNEGKLDVLKGQTNPPDIVNNRPSKSENISQMLDVIFG